MPFSGFPLTPFNLYQFSILTTLWGYCYSSVNFNGSRPSEIDFLWRKTGLTVD